MDGDDLYLRPIRPGDKVTGFSLGDKNLTPLKTFLRKDARDHHNNNVSKTFLLAENPDASKIYGYITLVQ